MSKKERMKDLLIAISGFSISTASFWIYEKTSIGQEWILKFGVYAGIFTMLIYCLRLKLAAEDVDPDSREAFKEYLKLGSFYSFILFVVELPIMLSVL